MGFSCPLIGFSPRGRPARLLFLLDKIFSFKESVMKLRLIFSAFVMVALFALGSASAKDAATSSNNYLALGDSVAFAYIDQAGYEYYYPTNFVGYADYVGLTSSLNLADAGCP